jgi:hypothetical protein
MRSTALFHYSEAPGFKTGSRPSAIKHFVVFLNPFWHIPEY